MNRSGFDADTVAQLSKRRAEFDSRLALVSNPELKKKYQLARSLTVLAASKFEALVDAGELYRQERATDSQALEEALAAARPLIKEADELITRLQSAKDPQTRERLEVEAREFALKTDGKHALMVAWGLSQPASLAQLLEPLGLALRVVLHPNMKELAQEMGVGSAELALHLMPVLGLLLSAGLTLNRWAALDESRTKSVDDYLNYLDAYAIAMSKWCQAADALVERLRRAPL